MEGCGQCGFVYADHAASELQAALRRRAGDFRARLLAVSSQAGGDRVVRAHPLAGVWSALEYACHVRDVLEVQRSRLALALREERPVFVSMEREERVVRDRYNDQDPNAVAEQMVVAGELLAVSFAALDDPGWARVGVYNWPERAERSMLWLARHTLHELTHHLDDFDRVVQAASGGHT